MHCRHSEGVPRRRGQTLQSSTTVPDSEHCMAAKLGCQGNPHCSPKGWAKEPTCVQAPAHHTSMRTLDTAWGNDLTAQPSASPHQWQRSKGPQVRRSSQPPSCGCMDTAERRPGPQGRPPVTAYPPRAEPDDTFTELSISTGETARELVGEAQRSCTQWAIQWVSHSRRQQPAGCRQPTGCLHPAGRATSPATEPRPATRHQVDYEDAHACTRRHRWQGEACGRNRQPQEGRRAP